ncbi:hypothetical protein ACHFCA_11985 [Delftia tsuruhatensis]
MRETAGRLQANAQAVGAQHLKDGPLATVQASDWSVRWQQQMVDAAQALHDAGQGFAEAAQQLGRLLRIEWPALGRQARSALGVIARAACGRRPQPGFLRAA